MNRLGRRDRGWTLAEGVPDRGRFRRVAYRRGGGMGVDVSDVSRRKSRVLHRQLHRPLLSGGIGTGIVAGVAGVAVAAKFCVDAGTATPGNAFAFENER